MASSFGRISDNNNRGRPPPLRLAQSLPGRQSTDSRPPLISPPPSTTTLLQSPISPFASPTLSFRSPPRGSTPLQQRSRRRTSATPPPDRLSVPAQRQALDDFAESCKAFFYHNDGDAEEKMTRRLAALPAHEKRYYTKLQASIRAAFHREAATRRRHEFRAHLTSTEPGCSLTPAARADPRGRQAASERGQRFAKFVDNWCSPNFPGTAPFFDALWAIMSLQSLPPDLGGAGGALLEWEIDDAVFQEAAGKGFMLDAVDTLKGVLGFEPIIDDNDSADPLLSAKQQPQIRSTTASSAPEPISRPRAASNPFIDGVELEEPGLSHSLPSTASSPRNVTATLPPAAGPSFTHPWKHQAPATPPPPGGELALDIDAAIFIPPASPKHHPEEGGLGVILDEQILHLSADDDNNNDDETPEDCMRVWAAPDLTDHEFSALRALFPSFIGARKLPRLNHNHKPRPERLDLADLEAGELVHAELPSVRHGTGVIRLGSRTRSPGYRGSWWRRFVAWWQHLFC